MANDKDFKVKNGVQPTRYVEGLGTVVSGSVGYSLASASYDNKSFSTATQNANASGVFFKPDGTKAYVIGAAANAVLYQYGLSTAWDASTGSYDSVSFTLTDNVNNVFFKPDGTSMYAMNSTDDALDQYNLSTAWDITSSSYSQSFSYATQDNNAGGIFFKPDGTKMYIAGWTTDKVYEYNLSTAWDISTASYVQDVSIRPDITNSNPTGVFFTPDGLSMIVNIITNDLICKYTLSTAWDISTASYTNVSLDVTAVAIDPYQIAFKPDGTKMFVVSPTTDGVFQYSTVLNTDTLDLSTGGVFNYTPTASKTLKVSNPAATGTNSGATLLVNGNDLAGVNDKFSTTLYTGNAGTQTITNGINLSGDGGLVWTKSRTNGAHNELTDTVRGGGSNGNAIRSNGAEAQGLGDLESFTSSGFVMGYNSGDGNASQNYVSWAFKKTSKFFDIVTYTGTGSVQSIAHNLGSVPGMMIFKKTSASENWAVYHRGANGGTDPEDYRLELNETFAQTNRDGFLNDTAPTSTHFTVGTDVLSNANGQTYVVYLFGHDTSSGPIQCGSYTGNGQSTGVAQNLGFRPQFMLFKNASASSGWTLADNVRGEDKIIEANTTGAEYTADVVDFTDTGFTPKSNFSNTNTNGHTFIYMAIAAEDIPSTTYDSSIKWSGGEAPTSPAIGETDVITLDTTDGGTTYRAAHAIDGAK